ncbi:2'-5' RNA ligase family protein [Actinokineospora fastidiosa]|uniref:RNA 2',3'-cyclic phosphodiesterase n=1 Tax=Actinokineospora fastidiosa TaxID=1816 RepID=A0A918GJD3_9PSEU|nr:2'-5' RNA ligase family protein [Actinokineospora fastidiosa]GGS39033.1 RNA 2',3'-cyclic phosphodiesterase [Actinokineospora fastidiosa]
MTRYFAAFPLPDPVADHLAAALPPFPAAVRPEPRHHWHITLAYYGPDDPDARLTWLTERVHDHPAPRVRLSGVGGFPGVTWMGVDADLDAIAEAATAKKESRPYVPHVTIGRQPRPGEWAPDLADYRGPEWIAPEVVLYSSEQGRYTRVGGVRLRSAPTC